MTLSIDQCIERAKAAIDEMCSNAMQNYIAVMRAHGGTDEEINRFAESYGEMLDAERDVHLEKIRAWLERGGETLQ